MIESQIQAAGLAFAKARKWFTFKIMRANINGIPDTFQARRVERCPTCGNETHVLLIEYKTATGRLSEQQVRRIAELRAAGVHVEVCHSVEEAKALLC